MAGEEGGGLCFALPVMGAAPMGGVVSVLRESVGEEESRSAARATLAAKRTDQQRRPLLFRRRSLLLRCEQ